MQPVDKSDFKNKTNFSPTSKLIQKNKNKNKVLFSIRLEDTVLIPSRERIKSQVPLPPLSNTHTHSQAYVQALSRAHMYEQKHSPFDCIYFLNSKDIEQTGICGE